VGWLGSVRIGGWLLPWRWISQSRVFGVPALALALAPRRCCALVRGVGGHPVRMLNSVAVGWASPVGC